MIGSLAVRIAGLGLQFVLAVLLARALGDEGYGLYAAGTSMAAILAGLSAFGLPNLLLRDMSRAKDSTESARLVRNHAAAAVTLAIFTLAAAVLAAAAFGLTGPPLAVALVLFPFIAFTQFRQSAALALFPALRALAPEQVLAPIAIMAILAASGGFSGRSLMAATGATAAAAAIVLLAASAAILRRAMPTPSAAASGFRALLANGWPFFLEQFPRQLFANADIVIVGLFLGGPETGAYALASRMAGLIALALFAVNIAAQPLFAALPHAGKDNQGADLAISAAFLSFAGGLIIMLAVIFAGAPLLALAAPGIHLPSGLLAMLAAAQLANCAFGPNGMILLMSGHEKLGAAGAWIQAALLAAITVVFAAQGDLLAAAAGVFLAMVSGNIVLSWLLWKRTGLLLHPFANRRQRLLSLTLLRR